MRKVTFGVANSLDNYIARKDGGVDWLLWGKEAAQFMTEFWKTIDTVLMDAKPMMSRFNIARERAILIPASSRTSSRVL